jgi:DNA (cytosine-5)-methyltransferase 1
VSDSPLTFGSLFAGIGGLDLGLERAGMECRWQVEIDDYATRVLERHWTGVRRWRDVRTFPPTGEDWRCDLICGGFPCPPVSLAGRRGGATDERWLWPEFCRIVRCIRPRYVLVENVPGLLSADAGRLFGGILRDLAHCGYDAEWSLFSACAVGAPHTRERVFIMAYPNSQRWQRGRNPKSQETKNGWPKREPQRCLGGSGWSLETRPPIERVAHGIPNRVDRLRCLGNAVVPQVAEFVGRMIVEFDNTHTAAKRAAGGGDG